MIWGNFYHSTVTYLTASFERTLTPPFEMATSAPRTNNALGQYLSPRHHPYIRPESYLSLFRVFFYAYTITINLAKIVNILVFFSISRISHPLHVHSVTSALAGVGVGRGAGALRRCACSLISAYAPCAFPALPHHHNTPTNY